MWRRLVLVGCILIILLGLGLFGYYGMPEWLLEGERRLPDQADEPNGAEEPTDRNGLTEREESAEREKVPLEDGQQEPGPAEPNGEPDEPAIDEPSEQAHRRMESADLTVMYPEVVFRFGNPDQKQVALTFDDGPDERYTPAILDILKQTDTPATFFITGVRAEKHPEIMRRIVDEGHAVGSHGYRHSNFASLSPAEIRRDLERNRQLIQRLTGREVDLFRPPYAALDDAAVQTIAGEGYKIVLWNVDSLDWRSLERSEILDNILPYVENGSIILQHCAGESTQDLSGTVEALPEIISRLRRRGFRFATVPELLQGGSGSSLTQWYRVKPGDSLWVISRRTDVPVRRLLELNPGLRPDNLSVGQTLRISQ